MLDYFGISSCDKCSSDLLPETQELEQPVNVVSCGHVFCGSCWASISFSVCPLCRTAFDPDTTQILDVHPDGVLQPREHQRWVLSATEQATRLEEAIESIARDGCSEPLVNSVIHECFSFLQEQPELFFTQLRTSAKLLVALVNSRLISHRNFTTIRHLKSTIRQLTNEKAELRKRVSEVESEKEAEIAIALACEPDLRDYSLKLRQKYNVLHRKYSALLPESPRAPLITSRDPGNRSLSSSPNDLTSSPNDLTPTTSEPNPFNRDAVLLTPPRLPTASPSSPDDPHTPTQNNTERFIPVFSHPVHRRMPPLSPSRSSSGSSLYSDDEGFRAPEEPEYRSNGDLEKTPSHPHPGTVLAQEQHNPNPILTNNNNGSSSSNHTHSGAAVLGPAVNIPDDPYLPHGRLGVNLSLLNSFLEIDSPSSSPPSSTHSKPSIMSLHNLLVQSGFTPPAPPPLEEDESRVDQYRTHRDGDGDGSNSAQSTLRRVAAYRNMHVPVRPILRDSMFSTWSGISTPPSPSQEGGGALVVEPLRLGETREQDQQQQGVSRRPSFGARARAASTTQIELHSSRGPYDHRRLHSDPVSLLSSAENSDSESFPHTTRSPRSNSRRDSLASLLLINAPAALSETVPLPPSSETNSLSSRPVSMIAPSVMTTGTSRPTSREGSMASTWGTVSPTRSTISSLGGGIQLIGFHNHVHNPRHSVGNGTTTTTTTSSSVSSSPQQRRRVSLGSAIGTGSTTMTSVESLNLNALSGALVSSFPGFEDPGDV